MIAIIGLFIVVVSVLGGFSLAGGSIPALFHISEFIVIGGTALGTILISTPGSLLKELFNKLQGVAKPSPFTKVLYLDALMMIYELFQIARRDGLVAIETHIEHPENSSVFQKYASITAQHHAITFLCDSLRLVLVGSVASELAEHTGTKYDPAVVVYLRAVIGDVPDPRLESLQEAGTDHGWRSCCGLNQWRLPVDH